MAGRWRTGDAPRFAEATELDWNQMRPVRRNSEYTNDQVAVWSNTFDVKRLSAAAESTGIHLSPLESTRFVEK